MTHTSHDSETPAHGQQVITVCALIHKDFGGVEKIFLPKRADTKKFLPGVFELPGGHVEFGEDLVAGLKREIFEEFQMNITVGDPFAAFTYTNHIKGSHSIEVIYFAEFIDGGEVVLHPEDHSMYLWVSEDELSSVYSEDKGENDIEFQKIQKGFELLSGNSPQFA